MEKTLLSPEDYFTEVKECDYKNELYSVRDNGAIMRHPRDGKLKRKNDSIWTFGVKNNENGYMYIGSHRVHIIVATAFYGKRDSKIYIVDHIDTNRCNNRPDNLRWLTRLENALLNPVTLSKITFCCNGDIMKFINNPSCIRELSNEPDIAWMRTVSAEEAKAAYFRVQTMISKRQPTESHDTQQPKNNDWRFTAPKTHANETLQPVFTRALYPSSALQKDWITPTEFLCCPENPNSTLQDYFNNLKIGKDFARNRYCISKIMDYAFIESDKIILVMTLSEEDDAVKPYGHLKIYHSGIQFIHESKGTFFEEIGVRKYFTLEQGKEWTGGNCIDDNC